jgi:hypothetical protein
MVSGLTDTSSSRRFTGVGGFAIGDAMFNFTGEVHHPAPASFVVASGDSYVTSTRTDENGDFYVQTYSSAVNVTISYQDVSTNSRRQIKKTIYSGSATPEPTALEVVVSKPRNVTLKWEYPAEYGPIELSKFILEMSTDLETWTEAAVTNPTRRTVEVANLEPGNSYHFRLRALSNVGQSLPSNQTAVYTPLPLFDAPGSASASLIKTNSAKLTWLAPSQLADVKNYLVDYSLDGNNWISIKKSESRTTALNVSGLTIGTQYRFRIAATNRIEIGDYAYVTFSTIATITTAPTALLPTAISGAGFALSWNAPVSHGGSALRDYVVEVNGGGLKWAPLTQPASNGPTMNLTGLKPGTKYSVRVKAVNGVGVSKASTTMVITTPAQLPSSVNPTLRSVTTTSASIAWVAPSHGGSKITDYLAEYSTDNGQTWKTVVKNPSSSTTLTLRGLTTRTTYLVRISAKNSVGFGSASNSLEVRTN